MPHYVLKTLGCKANLYDSQHIEEQLQQRGWSPHENREGEVQLCIVNSCTVTDEADRQTRKIAAKLSRENPQATVIVTGCAAEVDPEGLIRASGIHYVVGNQNKNEIVDLVLKKFEGTGSSSISADILNPETKILGTVKTYGEVVSRHPHDREWPAATDSFFTPPTQLKGYAAKTRSFLKIQEGCNSFCTYCIIPYGRGPSRSLQPIEVIQQVHELVAQGIREVIITGTNIGDYGTDLGSGPILDELLEKILAETQLERLRVSSLDPTEITPRMMALMKANPRFCPHFHVSLQSPHSRILRLMKRKYSFDEVKSTLEAIAEIPSALGGPFVGMDIITGFPGETDEEFEWGLNALADLPWTRLHVFPYSEREGTPATRLPNSVPQAVRMARAKKLNQLSMQRLTQHYKNVLLKSTEEKIRLESVLVEQRGKSQWVSGYTPNYLRVLIPKDMDIARNDLITVEPSEMMIDSQAYDVGLVSKVV